MKPTRTHDYRGQWERTDLVKTRLKLAHARNRVAKLRNNLTEQEQLLEDLLAEEARLQKEAA